MKRILLFIAMLAGVLPVFAQNIRGGSDINMNSQVDEDLYITGGTVTISAPIHSDLVIAGGTVFINDTVTGDILVGGGKVTVNGFVGDDVRGLGGELHLNGSIGGDLVASGGTVEVSKGCTVFGNTLIGAGTTIINGNLLGNLNCRSGYLTFNGVAEQNVDCRGGDIVWNGIVKGSSILAAPEIKIGSASAFYQGVHYWNDDKSLDFKDAIKTGTGIFDSSLEMQTGKWHYLGFASAIFVLWYLGVIFAFILLLEYLMGDIFKKAAVVANNRPLNAIGKGILFIFIVPVAIIVLLISIIGIPLGLLSLFVYAVVLLLLSSAGAVLGANLFCIRSNRNWSKLKISFFALLIFICLKMIYSIPVLGWLVGAIIGSLVLGSLISGISWKRAHTLS